jgi:hypothetical protein
MKEISECGTNFMEVCANFVPDYSNFKASKIVKTSINKNIALIF